MNRQESLTERHMDRRHERMNVIEVPFSRALRDRHIRTGVLCKRFSSRGKLIDISDHQSTLRWYKRLNRGWLSSLVEEVDDAQPVLAVL